jgi:hypothetical protein
MQRPEQASGMDATPATPPRSPDLRVSDGGSGGMASSLPAGI